MLLKENFELLKEENFEPESSAALERINQEISERQLKTESDIKDVIFKEMIINELVSQFINELKEIGFSDDELEKLAVMFYDQKEDYLSEILAIPYEQRQLFYSQMKDKDKTAAFFFNKIKSVRDALKEISDIGQAPILGFHNSPKNIKPVKEKRSGKEISTWEVLGTENSDLSPHGVKIAYAYDNYHGKYTEGEFNYVYVVRIKELQKKFREKEGHYWEMSYPIVAKIKKDPLFDNVETLYRKLNYLPQTA